MAAAPVAYERHGAAGIITIDRPERRNAIDGPTADALAVAYEEWVADLDARVLVLTGAGDDAFCAGADLKALGSFRSRLGARGGPLGFTRRHAPRPTIAAIAGWCLAGGLELALWCDLRLATPSTRLGFPERRFGVPLVDGGTQRLPRIVGMGRALDLILTGRIMPAQEAAGWGLVNEIVADPVARALEYAQALGAVPQDTLLADREAALVGFGLPLDAGLALEANSSLRTFGTAQEGAARFAGGAGRGGAGAGVDV